MRRMLGGGATFATFLTISGLLGSTAAPADFDTEIAPTMTPIHATFVSSEKATHYVIDAGDENGDELTITWRLIKPNPDPDPDCIKFEPPSGQKQGPFTPPVESEAIWHHGDADGCTHAGTDHEGTIEAVVSDGTLSCTATYDGTEGNDTEGPAPVCHTLLIRKTPAVDSAKVGQTVQWTITIRNAGPLVQDVGVREFLYATYGQEPAGDPVPSSGDCGAWAKDRHGNWGVDCSFGALDKGEVRVIQVTTKVVQGLRGRATNLANALENGDVVRSATASVKVTGCATAKGSGSSTPAAAQASATAIRGTSGNDVLCGTAGADTIRGGGGGDSIYGLGGNDFLYGGAGGDKLYGGVGRDKLYGGPGTDKLVGGPGQDRCVQNGTGKGSAR